MANSGKQQSDLCTICPDQSIKKLTNMSGVMRKPTFCICENKDADQLRGKREADQRLCFRYLDSTIPLLAKSKISSFLPPPVSVQPGCYQTWSESTLLVFSCCGSYIGSGLKGCKILYFLRLICLVFIM